jgi:hypothetical protein
VVLSKDSWHEKIDIEPYHVFTGISEEVTYVSGDFLDLSPFLDQVDIDDTVF